jgi:hypothetical protein
LEKQKGKGRKLLWDGREPSSPVAGQQTLYAGKPENDSGRATPIAQGQSNDKTIPKPLKKSIKLLFFNREQA